MMSTSSILDSPAGQCSVSRPLDGAEIDAVLEHLPQRAEFAQLDHIDRKSTRLNSSHLVISYAVFCLKKKKIRVAQPRTGLNKKPRTSMMLRSLITMYTTET